MPNVICITGMHRSGTSLTASWLQACGLKVDSGRLMGSDVGNVKGHFEDEDFVDFHSKILRDNISQSNGWIINEDFILRIAREDQIQLDKIKNRRNDNEQWGWKDPRTVAFLDLWKEELPELKFLFVWRPAIDVIESLIKRSQKASKDVFKINKERAYKTWCWYNIQLLKFHRKHPENSILISTESLIKKDELVYHILKKKFDLELNYYDINSLFKKDLFNKKKKSFFKKIDYKRFGVSEIEKMLEKESLDFSEDK